MVSLARAMKQDVSQSTHTIKPVLFCELPPRNSVQSLLVPQKRAATRIKAIMRVIQKDGLNDLKRKGDNRHRKSSLDTIRDFRMID
jgi:hypothetical protein